MADEVTKLVLQAEVDKAVKVFQREIGITNAVLRAHLNIAKELNKIQLGGKAYTQAEASVKKYSKASTDAEKNLKKLNVTSQDTIKTLEDKKRKLSNVIAVYNTQGKATSAVDKQLKNVNVTMSALATSSVKTAGGMLKSGQSIQNFVTATQKADKSAGRLRDSLGQVTGAAERFSKSAKAVLVSWQSVGRILVGTIISRFTTDLVRGFQQAVSEAVDFSIQIGEIKTISQNAALSTEEWTKQLRALSDEFGRGTADVAEAAYQALSNQIGEGVEVVGFLEDAFRLARITVTDASVAVSALTAIINSYNLTAADADKISAQLFKTIELGRLRLDQIADTIGNVTAIADELGIAYSEIGGAIATLTIQGVDAARAQTYLRNIMLKLIKPTKAMTAFLDQLGVSSGQAAIQAFGFGGFLQKLEQYIETTTNPLGELGAIFGRIRAIVGAAGLDFEKFAEAELEVREATKSAIKALQEVRTPGRILRDEINKIANVFKVDLGESVVETLAAINETFISFSKAVKIFVGAIKLIGSALASLALARTIGYFWGLTTSLKAVIFALRGSTFAVTTLTASLVKLQVAGRFALKALGGIWTLIGATAIFFAIKALEQYKKKLDETTKDVTELTKEQLDAIERAAGETADAIREKFQNMDQAYLESFKRVKQGIFAEIAEIRAEWNKFLRDIESYEQIIELKVEAYLDLGNSEKAVEEGLRLLNAIYTDFKIRLDQGTAESLVQAKEKMDEITDTIGDLIEGLKILGEAKTPVIYRGIKKDADEVIVSLKGFRVAAARDFLAAVKIFEKTHDLAGAIQIQSVIRLATEYLEEFRSGLNDVQTSLENFRGIRQDALQNNDKALKILLGTLENVEDRLEPLIIDYSSLGTVILETNEDSEKARKALKELNIELGKGVKIDPVAARKKFDAFFGTLIEASDLTDKELRNLRLTFEDLLSSAVQSAKEADDANTQIFKSQLALASTQAAYQALLKRNIDLHKLEAITAKDVAQSIIEVFQATGQSADIIKIEQERLRDYRREVDLLQKQGPIDLTPTVRALGVIPDASGLTEFLEEAADALVAQRDLQEEAKKFADETTSNINKSFETLQKAIKLPENVEDVTEFIKNQGEGLSETAIDKIRELAASYHLLKAALASPIVDKGLVTYLIDKLKQDTVNFGGLVDADKDLVAKQLDALKGRLNVIAEQKRVVNENTALLSSMLNNYNSLTATITRVNELSRQIQNSTAEQKEALQQELDSELAKMEYQKNILSKQLDDWKQLKTDATKAALEPIPPVPTETPLPLEQAINRAEDKQKELGNVATSVANAIGTAFSNLNSTLVSVNLATLVDGLKELGEISIDTGSFGAKVDIIASAIHSYAETLASLGDAIDLEDTLGSRILSSLAFIGTVITQIEDINRRLNNLNTQLAASPATGVDVQSNAAEVISDVIEAENELETVTNRVFGSIKNAAEQLSSALVGSNIESLVAGLQSLAGIDFEEVSFETLIAAVEGYSDTLEALGSSLDLEQTVGSRITASVAFLDQTITEIGTVRNRLNDLVAEVNRQPTIEAEVGLATNLEEVEEQQESLGDAVVNTITDIASAANNLKTSIAGAGIEIFAEALEALNIADLDFAEKSDALASGIKGFGEIVEAVAGEVLIEDVLRQSVTGSLAFMNALLFQIQAINTRIDDLGTDVDSKAATTEVPVEDALTRFLAQEKQFEEASVRVLNNIGVAASNLAGKLREAKIDVLVNDLEALANVDVGATLSGIADAINQYDEAVRAAEEQTNLEEVFGDRINESLRFVQDIIDDIGDLNNNLGRLRDQITESSRETLGVETTPIEETLDNIKVKTTELGETTTTSIDSISRSVDNLNTAVASSYVNDLVNSLERLSEISIGGSDFGAAFEGISEALREYAGVLEQVGSTLDVETTFGSRLNQNITLIDNIITRLDTINVRLNNLKTDINASTGLLTSIPTTPIESILTNIGIADLQLGATVTGVIDDIAAAADRLSTSIVTSKVDALVAGFEALNDLALGEADIAPRIQAVAEALNNYSNIVDALGDSLDVETTFGTSIREALELLDTLIDDLSATSGRVTELKGELETQADRALVAPASAVEGILEGIRIKDIEVGQTAEDVLESVARAAERLSTSVVGSNINTLVEGIESLSEISLGGTDLAANFDVIADSIREYGETVESLGANLDIESRFGTRIDESIKFFNDIIDGLNEVQARLESIQIGTPAIFDNIDLPIEDFVNRMITKEEELEDTTVKVLETIGRAAERLSASVVASNVDALVDSIEALSKVSFGSEDFSIRIEGVAEAIRGYSDIIEGLGDKLDLETQLGGRIKSTIAFIEAVVGDIDSLKRKVEQLRTEAATSPVTAFTAEPYEQAIEALKDKERELEETTRSVFDTISNAARRLGAALLGTDLDGFVSGLENVKRALGFGGDLENVTVQLEGFAEASRSIEELGLEDVLGELGGSLVDSVKNVNTEFGIFVTEFSNFADEIERNPIDLSQIKLPAEGLLTNLIGEQEEYGQITTSVLNTVTSSIERLSGVILESNIETLVDGLERLSNVSVGDVDFEQRIDSVVDAITGYADVIQGLGDLLDTETQLGSIIATSTSFIEDVLSDIEGLNDRIDDLKGDFSSQGFGIDPGSLDVIEKVFSRIRAIIGASLLDTNLYKKNLDEIAKAAENAAETQVTGLENLTDLAVADTDFISKLEAIGEATSKYADVLNGITNQLDLEESFGGQIRNVLGFFDGILSQIDAVFTSVTSLQNRIDQQSGQLSTAGGATAAEQTLENIKQKERELGEVTTDVVNSIAAAVSNLGGAVVGSNFGELNNELQQLSNITLNNPNLDSDILDIAESISDFKLSTADIDSSALVDLASSLSSIIDSTNVGVIDSVSGAVLGLSDTILESNLDLLNADLQQLGTSLFSDPNFATNITNVSNAITLFGETVTNIDVTPLTSLSNSLTNIVQTSTVTIINTISTAISNLGTVIFGANFGVLSNGLQQLSNVTLNNPNLAGSISGIANSVLRLKASVLGIDATTLTALATSLKSIIQSITSLTSNFLQNTNNVINVQIQGQEQLQDVAQQTTSVLQSQVAILRQLVAEAQYLASQLGAVTATSGGLMFKRYTSGGSTGAIGNDTLLGMFNEDEFVTNAQASRKFLPLLTAINSGARAPRYTSGETVTTNFGDINVSVEGGSTPDISARRIGEAIRRELKRGTLRLS